MSDENQILYQPLPEMSVQAMSAFCNDLAQQICDGDTIAQRYGFGTKELLRQWLMAHPLVWKKIQELKAIWESDDNIEVRAKKLAGLAVIEAIPGTAQIMYDTAVNPAARIDALKQHANIAALGGPPPRPPQEIAASAGGGGNKFSVQIVFASTGQVEQINTREPVTIEGEEVDQ